MQLTLAMAAGIITASLFPAGSITMVMATVCMGILVPVLALLVIKNRPRIFSVWCGLSVFIILYITGIIIYQASLNRIITLPGGSSSYILRAEDTPEVREKSVRLPVKLIACNDARLAGFNNRMMLYFRDTTGLNHILPGSYIEIRLSPRLIDDPDTTDNFDYTEYMRRKGFAYFAFAGKEFNTCDGRKGLRNQASIFRAKIIRVLSGTRLSGEELALTAALTLGYRDLLGDDMTEDFRRAGITHILAVSGLHVGIVSFIIMNLLSFLKGRAAIFQVIISLIVIWIFAFTTGLSPSVTRASLMFSFLHAGKLLQRPVNNINSLLASAFLVLVLDPAVLFDAGFQLSYSAVIFILLFYRPLYTSLAIKGAITGKLWSMTVVTLLAQLGTLPFVIFYFNSIPIISFMTNIIAIPSAFIILSGGLASIISSPLPLVQEIASEITGKTAWFLVRIADRASAIPFSTIETGNTGLPLFISLLFLVPLGTSYFTRKDSVHPHLLLVSVIITIIASAA